MDFYLHFIDIEPALNFFLRFQICTALFIPFMIVRVYDFVPSENK
jgi:hypothetical protein